MPIDFAGVQSRLAAACLDVGVADGVAGPKTYGALLAYVAGRTSVGLQTAAVGAGCAKHLPEFDIDATVARLANFVGQTCHESGGFQFLREIWGPTQAQKTYEGRLALGNVNPGDGFRFLGRGLIQITGRANYKAMGDALGLDLVGHPELAETPEVAVLTACQFWKTRGLNALADQGLNNAITVRINGGNNGAAERTALVARARQILGGQ